MERVSVEKLTLQYRKCTHVLLVTNISSAKARALACNVDSDGHCMQRLTLSHGQDYAGLASPFFPTITSCPGLEKHLNRINVDTVDC